jgi:hypothetical protein
LDEYQPQVFLFSISLHKKNEKSLISFQRKPNDLTVILGLKGKQSLE